MAMRGKPTRHVPGTEGKVLALIKRYEDGFDMFHPQDATYDGRVLATDDGKKVADNRGRRPKKMKPLQEDSTDVVE